MSHLANLASASLVNGKFDAGGVKLYLECVGQGSPTVVLDAGFGFDSSTWEKVAPDLQSHTQVCAYDRAGMGRSDSWSGFRTSGQIADQLHTLLMNAGIAGPYVVVGHSLAGLHMLVFANYYPDEVAGVVLVDTSHPDQFDRWSAVLPAPVPGEPATLDFLRKGWAFVEDPNSPEPIDIATTLAQVRAVKSLGAIPLIVLSQTDPAKMWSDLPPEVAANLVKVWLDLQKVHASLSSDSSLILAEHSGHFIQQDEPQVVIDAILKLVDKARQK
jgi:pimeloyl-ACP methyl ester carboxylesterase